MRSWQRALIAGGTLLVAGAVATAVDPDGPHHEAAAIALTIGAVVALGIGGSIVASALVAQLVANQVAGIDVAATVEALRGTSAFVRARQELDIWLDLHGDEVRATAEHKFDLIGASRFPRRLPLRLYTDVAAWGSGGGFYALREPDDTQLRGAELDRYVREVDGRTRFQKAYRFRHDAPATFVVHTYGAFRRSDRLFWTVEHISRDFKVRVHDRRRLDGATVRVRVNHHRAREILDNMRPSDTPEGHVLEFSSLGEVLPYQGFELQWCEPVPAAASGDGAHDGASSVLPIEPPAPGAPDALSRDER